MSTVLSPLYGSTYIFKRQHSVEIAFKNQTNCEVSMPFFFLLIAILAVTMLLTC